MSIARPPCWPQGNVQPNTCALAHYARVVNGHNDLAGDWAGWKQRGRYLISPCGDRISPERMKGVLWRIDQETRLTAVRNRNASRKSNRRQWVSVVVAELTDWHARYLGSRAA